MFSPIKNFITYIQKNTSGNSIFGANSTTELSSKMETVNIKTEAFNANAQIENEIPKEFDKEGYEAKREEESTFEEEVNKDSGTDAKCPEIEITSLITTPTVSTEKFCEFEGDDIEVHIERSIMLKNTVQATATNESESIELQNYSNDTVICHDLHRNRVSTPTDDELEDFKRDPIEVLGALSSHCSNQLADEFCSVESAEESQEKYSEGLDDFSIENEVEEIDDNKIEDDQNTIVDTDLEVEEEKENEQNNVIEEEQFLDLDNFKNRNVIVMDEVDLNTSTASVDTNHTSDDPLAIACEDQEAFAADKAAALDELNLLNNSQISQDEDTRTTTDEDLRWLKTDLENNQPSCSTKVLHKSSSENMPEKEERNGDGSDSGLGSETSALHITTTSITDTSQLNITIETPTQTPPQIKTKDSEKISNSGVLRLTKSPPKGLQQPYRSNLKRHLEVHDAVEGLRDLTSVDSSLNDHTFLNGSLEKKPKRSINFDTVHVYYFPRQQGFSCVPSAGGCTLGMGARHIAFKTLTLAEHAAELRRAHRMQLQEINPRGSSSDDSEESEEDYLSEGSGSDLDGESNGFLQPVSPKQRRALLKAAGIRKIDPSEKAECRNIRNSREVCGCTCRDFCDPETCACSQSGIKCQVDRDMFPCGCSRDACGNTIGRVEFNPTRVRTHYIHTLMRLEMENRQQQNPYASAVAAPMQSTPSSYYQTHLQPQSNYSSGYASPAYNTATEMHQQSAVSSYYHTQTSSTSNSLYRQQTSLEMTHNSSMNSTATGTHYGIDSLDTSLFGGTTTATPSYGELMPVASYHYGNLQTQTSPFNTFHNTTYINPNSNTSSLSTSNTYSSCAVPSIPPFGAATTTEATGVYHSASSLTSLETTTAPSCSATGTASLENGASTNFISLATPLASSSRLSQINDLLKHNRNTTTALVAVSQNIETTESKVTTAACLTQINGNNFHTANLSLNTPAIDDVHKTCIAFEELVSNSPQTTGNDDYHDTGPDKPMMFPVTSEALTKTIEETSSPLLCSEFLSQTSSLCKDDKDTNIIATSPTIESSTIEVAAGN